MNSKQIPIGKQIKLVRLARHLKLYDLDDLSGVHYSSLSVIETGKFLPTPTQLAAIEAALGIRFSDPEVQAAFLILAGNASTEAASPGVQAGPAASAGNNHKQENPPNEQV